LKNRFTEEWVTEVFSRLFSLFEEQDIRNLGIPRVESCNNPIEYVAEYYRLEPSEIKGDSRAKEVVTPRYVAIYLARELTRASLPQIGTVFGNRKHATILYAYEKTKEMKEFDHNLRQEIKGLQEKIEAEYFC